MNKFNKPSYILDGDTMYKKSGEIIFDLRDQENICDSIDNKISNEIKEIEENELYDE